MKKTLATALAGVLVLSACGTDDENGESSNENEEEQEEASGNEENEEQQQEEQQQEEQEEEPPSAEEIIDEAIAFYDGLEGLYFVTEGDMDMDLDEEQENVPEGNITTTIQETQWDFIEDGTYYNRLELDMAMEGEEDGEAFSEDDPTEYQFSDLEDPAYTIAYDEGDEQAIRYEAGAQLEEPDMSSWAGEYEVLRDEAALTFVGEEEINGFQTYHIEADNEGDVSEHWFDQETYYEIKWERHTSADEEHAAGDTASDSEVVEFEANPEFDETLFEAPDDIEVVDGELEDTLSTADNS